MILVVYSWVLGGIQTFYLRLARERHLKGKETTVIYLGRSLDPEFLAELERYARVHCVDEFFYGGRIFPPILSTFFPRRIDRIRKLLMNTKHVHTCSCIEYFVAKRLVSDLGINVRVTIGVYHINEYSWKGDTAPPLFEKYNQKYFYDLIDRNNIIVFNETVPQRLFDMTGKKLGLVNIFPVGIDISNETKSYEFMSNNKLKICSVGRLVSFKTYNFYMTEVVSNLLSLGIDAIYDIYGDGPEVYAIQNNINEYKLSNRITLKGNLEYERFNQTVSEYDLFVGNGTAIIEASSVGIPSIIGIENSKDSKTYGFFSDITGYAYNIDNLYSKEETVEFIKRLLSMSKEDIKSLSDRHKEKSREFSIERCSQNFDNLPKPTINIESLSLSFYYQYLSSFLCANFLLRFGLYKEYASKYES